MMNKTEIKKELKEIRILEDATNICISNKECVEQLALERIDKMALMMRIIKTERKVTLDDIWMDCINNMESLVTEDNTLVEFWELGRINYLIHLGETLIKVEVWGYDE